MRTRPCIHTRVVHEHGDYVRYRLDGCRCYPCSAAVSAYNERRAKAITAGTWAPFVDLATVREHVLNLKSLGLGDRTIAALAGVTRKRVRDIAAGIRHDQSRGNPPITKVTVSTARRLLAIEATDDILPGGTFTDAAHTWAQIGDLLAAGWTRGRIAVEVLGAKHPALQLRQDRVTLRNARLIADAHRFVVGSVDDLELPTEPDWVLIDRAMSGERVTVDRAERAPIIGALRDRGLTPTQIADRLSMSGARVNQLLAEREPGAA
jgi:hypothetical protein